MMAPLTVFSISTGRLLHYITTITWREQHFYSTLCPSVLGICQWVTQLLLFSKHNICLWSGTNIYIFLKQMISISCNITDTVIVFCFCLLLFSFSFEGLTHPQLNMINFSNLLKCGWASHPIHGMTSAKKINLRCVISNILSVCVISTAELTHIRLLSFFCYFLLFLIFKRTLQPQCFQPYYFEKRIFEV